MFWTVFDNTDTLKKVVSGCLTFCTKSGNCFHFWAVLGPGGDILLFIQGTHWETHPHELQQNIFYKKQLQSFKICWHLSHSQVAIKAT